MAFSHALHRQQGIGAAQQLGVPVRPVAVVCHYHNGGVVVHPGGLQIVQILLQNGHRRLDVLVIGALVGADDVHVLVIPQGHMGALDVDELEHLVRHRGHMGILRVRIEVPVHIVEQLRVAVGLHNHGKAVHVHVHHTLEGIGRILEPHQL